MGVSEKVADGSSGKNLDLQKTNDLLMGLGVEIPDGPLGLGMTENSNQSFPAGKAGVGNL